MKLLRNYEDLSDAEDLSHRLRNKGIMTFVSSKKSHDLHRFRTGALNVGVWAVLPHQFQDAKELLRNKKHKVGNPLSIDEINKLERQSQESFSNSFNKLLVISFTGLLISGLVALMIYVLYGVISNA